MYHSVLNARANSSSGMARNMPVSVTWLAWQAIAARFSDTCSLTSTARSISASGVPNGLPSSAGPAGSNSSKPGHVGVHHRGHVRSAPRRG